MRSTVTKIIASVALVLLGCVIGQFLGRSSDSATAADRIQSGAGDAQPDVAPVLAKLQASIEELSSALRTRSVAAAESPSLREAVSPIANGSDHTAILLEKIDQLLARMDGVSATRRDAAQAWKGAGFGNLTSLWQRVITIRGKGEDDWASEAVTDLTHAHLGWTREDVFERYGAPFSLYATNGGLSLRYVAAKTEDGSLSLVVFDTFDGIVTQVWIDA